MVDAHLTQLIHKELEASAKVFGDFHKQSKLQCPPECGKCCLKPDLSCNPYELLPLAFYLVEKNLAESILERAKTNIGRPCVLLEMKDESSGKGRCGHYNYRPFVCRAFGVAGRLGKNESIELSVCRELKLDAHYGSEEFNRLTSENVPLLEVFKKRLESIDPKLLEQEIPINEAIVFILEKVLFLKDYQDS